MAEIGPEGRDRAVKRGGHVRLIAFFAALAALGGMAGSRWLDALGAPRESRVALWTTLGLTLLAAVVGVIVHRMTIARIRWRETDAYLARIERESEKYHALMQGAADILLIVDAQSGRVRESNARAREALELEEPPGAGGPHVDEFVAEPDRARFRSALERAGSAPTPAVSLAEVRLRPRGSAHALAEHSLVADARFAAVEFGGERVVQVSLRDRTKEMEMERQLQIRERMSSIGLLTAGVAHEINNPLEGIGNYIALLEKKDLTDDQRKRYLELVRHGFARIRDLVRDLLRFARPAAGEGSADLAEVVDRARKLVAFTQTFKGVAVECAGLDAPIVVVGDAGRLEQVVFNLLLNAATAMGSRGTIAIRAQRVRDDDTGAAQVELVVEDDGPGIAVEHLSKLFDPFFTTSGGTGLGLAVSYGIVRAHGGSMRAENREPHGARFTIRLPWPESASASITARTKSA
jgi:signal transduction histidine kinase